MTLIDANGATMPLNDLEMPVSGLSNHVDLRLMELQHRTANSL